MANEDVKAAPPRAAGFGLPAARGRIVKEHGPRSLIVICWLGPYRCGLHRSLFFYSSLSGWKPGRKA
jgi:hypothetical protein